MIAISYRREDSLPIVGRLCDRLQARFGKQNVFMDFDSIRPGVDFREQIKQTIENSNLVIAVIGSRWLGEQSDSSRRIDDPTDFVRLEIKYALERSIPIIPLLVDSMVMPKPEKLPPEIRELAFRNALPLDSGLDFNNHAERLISGIGGLVGAIEMQKSDATGAESKHSTAKQPTKRFGLVVTTWVLVIAAIGGWYLGFFQNFGKVRSVVTSANESQASPRISAATEAPALSDQSARVVKAGPIYKGTIRAQGEQSGSGTPLTINLAVDRKSGTMTQTSKSGDTVVKFNGVWDGTTLRAVTDAVIAKPKNTQWKPESFTLRFAEDWKRGSYECNTEGSLYTAELSPP
jgi:hypothetical protein